MSEGPKETRQFSLLVLLWATTVVALACILVKADLGVFAVWWTCFYAFFAWIGCRAINRASDELWKPFAFDSDLPATADHDRPTAAKDGPMSEVPAKHRFRFSLRKMFVVVTALSVYLGVLAFGLSQQSLSSPLWGPILFARDGAQENQTFGRVALLLFAGPVLVISINPRTLPSFLVASIAIALWLFLGIAGWGINV